ncbi:MAG TPA: phosphopantetheine-binding protein [Terriglobales bacterium]|nr:phosphopantetheine-binding protein [Terriglobales bacterium]
MDDVAKTIGVFIRRRFNVRDDDTQFTHDVHLWDSGYVDSLGVAEILGFLERQFEVRVPGDAMFRDDCTSVNGLARLVSELRGEPELSGGTEIPRVGVS